MKRPLILDCDLNQRLLHQRRDVPCMLVARHRLGRRLGHDGRRLRSDTRHDPMS